MDSERPTRVGDVLGGLLNRWRGPAPTRLTSIEAARRANFHRLAADLAATRLRLAAADEEIARLRAELDEATQAPTGFARTRRRDVALGRLARLRLVHGNPEQS